MDGITTLILFFVLIFLGVQRLSFPPGQRRAEGHKKVCAIRYTDPWSLIWAQQEQGTDIATHQRCSGKTIFVSSALIANQALNN